MNINVFVCSTETKTCWIGSRSLTYTSRNINLDQSDGKCVELRMHLYILEYKLRYVFQNSEIAPIIYLCLMVSNSIGERSFRKLRRTRNIFDFNCARKTKLAFPMSMEHEIHGDTDLDNKQRIRVPTNAVS